MTLQVGSADEVTLDKGKDYDLALDGNNFTVTFHRTFGNLTQTDGNPLNNYRSMFIMQRVVRIQELLATQVRLRGMEVKRLKNQVTVYLKCQDCHYEWFPTFMGFRHQW